MVAGHLQEKNDFYYIVLSYKDAAGKRKTKWEATGLSVKKNKKKAEALLLERRRNFMVSTAPAEIRLDDDILFSDFMLKWLEVTKSTVQITTYASYQGMVERVIVPYFRKRNIKLVDLKATDLQDFYTKQLERVKANSVIHYHANTTSSLRTLPLVPPIRVRLLMLKGQQDTYRRLCGKSYNRDYLGYLCVDEIGNIIRPNYVSEQFPKLLEKNGLRPIRFHDLRHSCASLLLANGVPMKQIQEWLGHSDFSTTANIYAHLDYASKLSSAQAMLEGLGYGNASA